MAGTNSIKQIFDFNLFGGLSNTGDPLVVSGKEAFINALNIWLLSKQGDFIRQPLKGGFLYNWLCKPLSDYNATRIYTSLKLGLTYDFSPRFVLQDLTVIPDYTNKRWKITMSGFSPDLQEYIDFSQDYKSLV